MTVFLSKVWSFDVPCGPLVFSAEGWRTNAIEKLKPGDRVVLVGTKNSEPKDEDRGRLLGMMEPSREPVAAMDFPIGSDPRIRDDNGNYRWPYGLLNKAAWVFPGKPIFEQLVSRPFHTNAAVGIVDLFPDEAATVLAQEHRPVPLLKTVATDKRLHGEYEARRRGAPPPSTTRAGIMHMRRAPASTYLFSVETESGRTAGYKVGWAFEWKARLREFNKVSSPTLGGLRYRARLHYLWDTAKEAFAMEQYLLALFDVGRHPGNREIVCGYGFKSVEDAWNDYIRKRRKGK